MIGRNVLMFGGKFYKFMFIIAACTLFIFHTTAATFAAIFNLIKIHSRPFAHAIVYLHSHAGGNGEVEERKYGQKKFFHKHKSSE